jgi:small subunit ribosomal protein S1
LVVLFSREYQEEMLYQLSRVGRPVVGRIGAVERLETLESRVWAVSFTEYPDYQGVVSESESGVDPVLFGAMVGQEVQVIVKGIDDETGTVACSRKEAVEKSYPRVMERIQADQIIEAITVAVVTRDERPVLVVDVGQGVLCDMPRSKASVRYTMRMREQYRPGQVVQAKVISVEPLELSIRAARPDPWQRAVFKSRSLISGTVYKIDDHLVFVEPDLAPGILGLAPVPLMGDISRGMRVSCRVRNFDPANRKLHLRLVNRL